MNINHQSDHKEGIWKINVLRKTTTVEYDNYFCQLYEHFHSVILFHMMNLFLDKLLILLMLGHSQVCMGSLVFTIYICGDISESISGSLMCVGVGPVPTDPYMDI
jgi:hypothetical protein